MPIEGSVPIRLQPVTNQRGSAVHALESAPEMRTSGPTAPAPRNKGRFEGALHQHLGLVWRLLRRAGLSAADADDAAQDVFWVLAQRLDNVPLPAERAFLVSTAMRVASERRRSKWYRSPTEPFESERFPILVAEPDQALELKRRVDMLDAALAQLDPREREVFVLAEIEELSKAEIALALRIPEGTVASRLQRARESFRSAVDHLQAEKGKLL
jgi:RNA polymerase sigma-70 factor (ECF subfamily)